MPPDLDRLSWSVAEEGDPRTRGEFAARYPEWADELERRVETVAARREAGRPTDFARVAPLAARGAGRPLGLAPALFGGIALGGAVLALALLLIAPRPAEPAPRRPEAGGGTRVGGGFPPAAGGGAPSPAASDSSGPSPIPATDASSPTDVGSEAPTTIRLQRTSLHAALGLIGEAGGLRLRIDPAIPDPEVQEDLVDLTPREMILSLGGRYGFRVVEEGPRSLFLVPLAEPGEGGGSEDRAGGDRPGELPASIGGTVRQDESRWRENR